MGCYVFYSSEAGAFIRGMQFFTIGRSISILIEPELFELGVEIDVVLIESSPLMKVFVDGRG